MANDLMEFGIVGALGGTRSKHRSCFDQSLKLVTQIGNRLGIAEVHAERGKLQSQLGQLPFSLCRTHSKRGILYREIHLPVPAEVAHMLAELQLPGRGARQIQRPLRRDPCGTLCVLIRSN